MWERPKKSSAQIFQRVLLLEEALPEGIFCSNLRSTTTHILSSRSQSFMSNRGVWKFGQFSSAPPNHTLTTRQTQAIQGISGVGKRGEYFYLNTRGGCHSIMCEVSSLWSMVVGRYNMVILLFLWWRWLKLALAVAVAVPCRQSKASAA